MTVVETLERDEAEQQRSEALELLGTDDREAIRDALLSGVLDEGRARAARRVSMLDYLLSD